MPIKRVILIIITIISLIPVFLSLIASINQPQVQSDLQLYQTNLVLQDPYQLALSQYQKAQQDAKNNLEKLENSLQKINSQVTTLKDNEINLNSQPITSFVPENMQLKEKIRKQENFLNELNLKLGILEAYQGNNAVAINTWDNINHQFLENKQTTSLENTASILKNLWNSQTQSLSDAEATLKNQLTGWFRYVSLKKLYQAQTRQDDLLSLEKQQQTLAFQALIKVSLVALIPLLGGAIGLGLLIFFIIQLALKKENSVLAINQTFAWKTPWNWEITWQVLVVGFFFIGQIILPILFSLLNIDASQFNLREKAVYVLASYLALALSGIGVLYLSIKRFFPLPKDLFRFKWLSNWIIWGVGGYLTALPLVVIVSLINQKIWQGQGGSNPLLSLALESQDTVVLVIFFVTAAVAAPIYEEIMFRGFLLPSLTRYIPVWAAIGLSGLLFAVAHLNLSEVLPLAMLGVILGVVYTRSRNLLASMLLNLGILRLTLKVEKLSFGKKFL